MLANCGFEIRYALRHSRVRLALNLALMSVGILLLVVLVIWWPAQHATRSQVSEIEHHHRIAHDKHYSTELAAAVLSASAQIADIEKKLDRKAVQTTLVQSLNQLARQHKLRILTSNYNEAKTQEGLQPTTHELTVQGGYSGLRGFLSDLASLPTLTVIEECSIMRNQDGGALKATLLLRTWRRSSSSETDQ